MATFYIDPSLDTNGDGSFATPRNIFPTAIAYGDVVLFKEDTVYNGQWTIPTPTGTGSPTNIVLIGTYDSITGNRILDVTRQATIRCTSVVADAILISNISYVTISNLHCISGNNFPASGVRALNSSYITVEYCTIENLPVTVSAGGYGIRFDNATGSGAPRSNWVIRHNEVKNIAGNSGILCVWSSTTGEFVTNITVENNYVHSLQKRAGATANGIVVQSRASIHYTDKAGLCGKGVQIKNNIIKKAPAFGLYVKGVNSSTTSQQNIVSGNTILDTGDGATDMHCLWLGACYNFIVSDNFVNKSTPLAGGATGTGIGIFIDYPGVDSRDGCEDILVTRNTISNTGKGSTSNTEVGGAGIFVLHSRRVTIAFNLVQYCLNGIVVWGGYSLADRSQNVEVYNNTLVYNDGPGIYVCKIADLVTVKNNLMFKNTAGVYTETSGAGTITNYTETYNLVWDCVDKWTEGNAPTTTAATITTRTPDASNLEANPKLTSTFSISNVGAAYQAGANVSTKVSMTGQVKLPLPSIGAYEYVSERAVR